jgi:TolB protein
VTRLAAALGLAAALAVGCGAHDERDPGVRAVAAPQRESIIAALEVQFGNPPQFEVITLTASGSGARSLIRVPAKGVERLAGPVWSPDAKRIYVVGSGPEIHGRDFVYYESDVYALPAEGDDLRRLTDTRDIAAVVPSPDGRQLVVAREELTRGLLEISSQMWLMTSDGDDARALLDAEKGRLDIPGSWSPDGKRIAFTRCPLALPDSNGRIEEGCGVYVVSPDGSGLRKLAERSSAPAFSPDGAHIAFVSDRDRNGIHRTGEDEDAFANELYVMDADGSNQRRLSKTPELDEGSPTWSPDGEWIAYAREGPAAFVQQVMIAKSDGSCERVVIGDAQHEADPLLSYGSPSWRPGRLIGGPAASCR